LRDLLQQSFLREYPVQVIHNGIDLTTFKSNVRKENPGAFTVLGVASDWGTRKGLDVFIALAKCLPKEYRIVLVGTNETVDQCLPERIISIHRTNNQHELAEIYANATVFVNPTREDTYPTVNMEAIACGTPVVTFRTGGSPEPITEGVNGFVVDCDDLDALKNGIIKVCTATPEMDAGCVSTATQFDMNDRFAEYIHLYDSLLEPHV
jgi:glycosyltransferase involved in cell wall biosynthesis